jgi:LuxR family maltose regulon positive regulatory protein
VERPVVFGTLLGPFSVEVQRHDRSAPVELSSRRARKLLAFLLVHPRRAVARSQVLEALWSVDADERAEANLHPTLTGVRRALAVAWEEVGLPVGAVASRRRAGAASGDVAATRFLAVRGDTLRLDPDIVWRTDVDSVEETIAAGRARLAAGDSEGARERWENAWRRFGGDFLAGWDEPWVEEPRQHWSGRRKRLLRDLADLYSGAGRHQDAIDARRSVLADEPLSEPDHRELLRSLSALGRRDLVRLHYERMTRLLLDELGVEPMPDTVAEYRQLMNSKPGPRGEG